MVSFESIYSSFTGYVIDVMRSGLFEKEPDNEKQIERLRRGMKLITSTIMNIPLLQTMNRHAVGIGI
jgi:hypothetical protein